MRGSFSRRGREEGDGGGSEKPEKKPVDLSETALREAALSYLDRYDATRLKLARVLERRIARSSSKSEQDDARKIVSELLDRFSESGLIDDRRFARHFVDAARRKGASARKIEQKLRERGVASESITSELRASADETGIDDREAALTCARKKRLGAKFDLTDHTQRGKALATLARQGFSFEAANFALTKLVRNDDG